MKKTLSKIVLILIIFSLSSFNFEKNITHAAATIYANSSTGDDSTGDGSSGSPYLTFHKAYTEAASGDTINLTGTFTWTDAGETGDTTDGYTIGKNLTIQGPSGGATIVQASASEGTATSRVFTVSAGYTVTFDDLTIRYGRRTNYPYYGGGIYNLGTTNVNRCNVSNNYAAYSTSGYGGGIANAGTLYVDDSTINDNYAYSQGGGVVNAYLADGSNTAYITNSTIAFNSTSATVATVGGAGFFIRSGTGYVTNSTIAYNTAPNGTGDTTGIDIKSGSTLHIKNSIVAKNEVNGNNVNYASGNFFDITNSGTLNDNGGNVFGKVSTAYNGVSFHATTWYDLYGNGAGDNVFTLHNTATTGSLNLDTSLSTNDGTTGTKTLAITDASSVAVGNAQDTANGSVSIPTADQRSFTRTASKDVGSFEYDADYTPSEPTVQASSVVFSSVEFVQTDLDWTVGNGSKSIVFMKEGSTGTATPVDETTYTASATFESGTQIGSTGWYAVYNGSGSSVTVTGLSEGTDYIAQVFTYNGITDGIEDYLTDTATNNPETDTTAEVTEPTSQATNIVFSSTNYTETTATWTNGNGTSRIVFMKAADTGTATPVDDTEYTANATFGSGTQIGSTGWYAVYSGTGTTVDVTGLIAGTDYIVQVFELDSYLTQYDYLTDTATNNPKTQATTAVETPSTQATNLAFSSVAYTQVDLSWTNGDGDRRAVFMRQDSTGTAAPADDTAYTANSVFTTGDQIGSTGWFCVYDGTGTSVTVTGLIMNTDYIAHVVEYGTSGAVYKYLTSSDTDNPNTQTTDNVTEPDTQASDLVFSSVSPTQMDISWTNGNGDERVVFLRKASTGTATPVDDTVYTANTVFESGTQIGSTGWYAVYADTGTSVTVTGLTPNKTYIAQVFEYNYSGSTYDYFTDVDTDNPNTQSTSAVASNLLTNPGAEEGTTTGWTVTNGGNGWAVTAGYAQEGVKGFIASYNWGTLSQEVDLLASGYTADYLDDTQPLVTFGTYIKATSGFKGGCTTDPYSFKVELRNASHSAIETYDTGNQNAADSWTELTDTFSDYGTGLRYIYFEQRGDDCEYWAGQYGVVFDNATLSVVAEPSEYTLTYSAGSNGSVTGTTSQTVEPGEDGTEVVAVPDTGYQFVNWSDGSIVSTRTDTNVSEDIDVTASFSLNVYSLTYTAGVNGSLDGISPQNAGHGGDGLEVTAVPNAGYAFDTWSDGVLTAARTDTNVTENLSVTASFVDATEVVYANSSTGSDITGTGTANNPYKSFTVAYDAVSSDGVLDLTGTFTWTDDAETGDAETTGYTIAKDITIRGQGADGTIIQSVSADNTADRRVFTIAAGSTVIIQDLAIRYGKVTGTTDEGGGVLNLGTVTVNDCEIYNNRVPSGYGGGGLSNRDTMTINDSAVYNNVAQYMGGGVLNSYNVDANGYLTITNSTIYTNEVTQVIAYTEGGGVHFRKGSGTITNTTVTDNTACGVGGVGMDDLNGTVTLKNNIFAGNHQKVHSYCSGGYYPKGFDFRQSGYGNVVDNGNNIIGGYAQHYNFTDSTDWTDTDRDGTFTKYGTATTGTLNFADNAALNSSPNKTSTFAITAGSIAINNGATGTNGDVTVPSLDQRGAARSSTTDIGAFEYEGLFLDVYTLTYLAGTGGSITGSALQSIPDGANGTAITATPNTGYEFVDWSDESTDNPRTDSSISDDVTVTANFQVITYDLDYAAGANGSLTGTASQTIDYGEDGTAVTAVADEGYNFINWSDGSVTNPRTDTSVTADVDVSATFAEDSYAFIYAAGANGSLSGTALQVVSVGEDGSAVTAVPNTGYSFVNWSDSSTDNPRTDTNASANFAVTANFSVDSYSFEYSAGSNGSLTGTTSQTVEHGSDGSAITVVPAAGYAFVNWSDSSTENPRTDTSASENISVTANFVINTFSLTYTVDSRGSLTGTTSQTINYGEDGAAVTAVSTSGYNFFRWSDGSTQNPRTDTNVTANKSVRAYFIRDLYTSTYTAGDNGTIVGDLTQKAYYGDSNRPVAAIPNAGYVFVNWSDSSTENPRTDTAISENIEVTANFGLNAYSLNYAAGANGSLTGTTSQSINHGENGSAVTAVPNSGFNFVKWSDGSVTNPRTDTNENVNVTATFGVDRYGLTYASGSNGSLTGTTAQLVGSEEDGAAVTAVPSTGYSFVNWSDGSTESSRTDLAISESMYVIANFVINSYTLSYAAGDNGSLTGTTSQTIDYGSNGSAVTAVPDSGYYFLNWSDGMTDNPRTDLFVTGNAAVTANFEENRAATTIYVNSSTGNDSTGDGTSGTPYKTFYKGYSMAAAGDILDLTGTFTWTNADEAGDNVITGYVIGKNLTIQGQGADTTIIQSSSLDNTADRRVFTILSGATVTIQNLTIRYGRVGGYGNDGGGIRNQGTTTIEDCEIYNNRTVSDSGGGISNRHILTVNNSAIYNNVAYYMGGGVVNSYYISDNGYLTITNSTISYNQQTTALAYMEGGGIHFRKGSGTITNSTISYNTATGVGGVGMDDPDGTLTIKNTIIANNIRRNSGYYVDFGFRQSGYGNIVDNGYNIVGVSHNYTWEGTGDWTDVNRDGTFVLYGTTTSGTIELEDSMSYNDNVSKTKTLSIASDSIAVDAGDSADNGSVSVPTADQRDFLREETPDIGAFEYLSPPSDSTAPVVFAISATPTTTTAVFEWTTNEAASSQVKYDPNQLNSTGTDIYNSDVGVTSHEVTLTGLVACTKYYYLVSSSDAAGNTSTSAEDNFVTLGCAGDAVASTVSETAALPEYGGIVNQTQGGLTIELDIPTGFAEDPTDFQIKGLESETVLDSLSSPTNYSSVGDSLFDIKALATPATTVEEFDSAVEVSMSYTEDDIAGLSEPSLKIYRNHDEEWSSLEDCTVDADANTVTCTTSNFSVLGLFGEVIAYEFTYIAGANGSLTGETAQEVEVGGDGSAVTAVPDANYSFVSWSDSSTENPRTDTDASEDLSVTASFAINSYTLSYAAGANGSLTGTTSQTINYGADATAVTAVPSEGYIFASWSDSSTENPRTDTSISADLSVTASFIVDTTEAIIEFFGGGRTGLIINPGVVVEDETTSYLFVDTELHWAEDYIKNLYEEGVISGRDETHFFPDDPITRAEFVKMVVMVMDYELLEDVLEPSFWDLNLDDWFTPYIETAKENGIIDGYGDSSFRPNIEITRGEALKIAVSAIYKGKLPEYEDTFNDVLPSDWFAPYVIYAFKNGIVTGYGDNEFGPANSMIRAEAAKIISLIK